MHVPIRKRVSGPLYCSTYGLLIIGLLAQSDVLELQDWRFWLLTLEWALFVVLLGLSFLVTLQLWDFTDRADSHVSGQRVRQRDPYSPLTAAFLSCVWAGAIFLGIGIFVKSLRPELTPLLQLLNIVIATFLLSVILIFYSVRIKVVLDQRKEEFEQQRTQLTEEQAGHWRGESAKWEFNHLLSLEIGIALLVACFMSLTYELFIRRFAEHRADAQHSRHMAEHERRSEQYLTQIEEAAEARHQRHLKESENSIFRALFGYGVDDKILQRIRSAIAVSQFARKGCTVSFEFHPLNDEEQRRCGKQAANLLAVLVTVSYDIYNNADKPAIYPPTDSTYGLGVEGWSPYFENSIRLEEKLDRFVNYSIKGCGKQTDCLDDREWSNKEKVETVYDPDEKGEEGIRRRLRGGRILVMPTIPTRVRYSYRLYKYFSDLHSWISPAPLTGVDIDVHNHTPKKLKFHVETIGEVDASRRDDSDNHVLWHDDLGMLPNQGFILYWSEPLPGKKALQVDSGPGEASKVSSANQVSNAHRSQDEKTGR